MPAPIKYIAFNDISVNYDEDYIRNYFEYNQIATISDIWVQVNVHPFVDSFGNSFDTQDVVVEINQWMDTEIAYNIIYNVNYCDGCYIPTSVFGDYIVAVKHELEHDYDTDEENQSEIDDELTISDSGYETEEDNEINLDDLTPFQQQQFTELFA
ncbi:MAG: hypothetical protein RLZ10_685 [Bacteroidota bacterium]|jgi:hypothetical protein